MLCYTEYMSDISHLTELCKQVRYHILTSTTQAGSGHPTSSLSAVELMTTLFFNGYLQQDISNFQNITNDRVIFSKGHASPLLYSLYATAGIITQKELQTLRTFGSRLEGHPVPALPFVDAATGSLGQGLSVGVGMALGIKLRIKNKELSMKREPKIFVLLGDSELAEGQNWEAMEIASYYKLNNLVGILDVNRLGQRGETMLGWSLDTYQKRIESFGWKTIVIKNGHDITEIASAYNQSLSTNLHSPILFIAKTIKGKGVSFLENQDGWHGKAVPKDRLQEALSELGNVDWTEKGTIEKPQDFVIGDNRGMDPGSGQSPSTGGRKTIGRIYHETELVATREAYGDALVALGKQDKRIVVLDAETSNSTYAEKFQKEFSDHFFEMYIAEQNMVSTALGFSKMGYVPFASSFAAFLTRAFDQIRMSQYSMVAGKKNSFIIAGSHAGCSIGVDGASQMALEDIAMMRSIRESTVLYPSDAISTAKLTSLLANQPGISYIRLTREKTPVIYSEREEFKLGGLKILELINDKLQITNQLPITNNKYDAVIFSAGITLHEALKAQAELNKKGIKIIVADLYSIKPLDEKTIINLAQHTNHIVVVEDHYQAGGIGEAVSAVLTNSQIPIANLKFTHLCVRKLPHSGKPAELLRYEEIDAQKIITVVQFAML